MELNIFSVLDCCLHLHVVYAVEPDGAGDGVLLQPPGGAPVPRPLLQLDLVQDSHLALKQHRFAGTVSVVL